MNPWFHHPVTTEPALASRQADTGTDPFTESQRAGLAAAIALAQADAAAALEPAKPKLLWHTRQPVTDTGLETSPAAPARLADTDDRPGSVILTDISVTASADGTKVPRSRYQARLSLLLSCLQPLLLFAILTVQAVLSLRLVWSNTAFLDEATYLAAGHAEIAHWLHGTPVPAYPTFFSGAPVIYPPIAALAAGVGGLAAARLLSLAFMLGATILLWKTAAKLFGRSAAVCAAAAFAVLGPTVRLGAFATFDAMALFLLSASACCVVCARHRDDSALLLVAGTALLALANATKYATLIFDPSIIAIAGLAAARNGGIKAAVARSGYTAAGTVGLLGGLLALGGAPYSGGLLFTTLARAQGNNRPLTVVDDAWRWVGLVCVVAVAGLILCVIRRDGRMQLMLLTVLATSGLLAPANQARIHSTISLSKHVDFGAWFAAVAAGYALSRLAMLARRRSLMLAAAGVAAVGIAVPGAMVGRGQAWQMFHNWPNSAGLMADMQALTAQYRGHYLVEDYDVLTYYLEDSTSWQQWSGTWYFRYTPPGGARPVMDLAAYRAAISRHFFSLIVLDFEATPQTDRAITADIRASGNYRVVGVIPSSVGQYTIWAYTGQQLSGSQHDDH